MKTSLRIAVTGLAASYPLGGVFWDYLQYALGLRRLGHDVIYIEDTGKWCYDPIASTFVEEGRHNAGFLARQIACLDPDLSDRWFFRDATGRTYGRSWSNVVDFCRTADLFIHVSASCWMRDEYFAAGRVAFIDTDPMYTQASIPDYIAGTIDDEARSRVDMLRQHDVFFTFAENVGAPECRIPRGLFDWIPTRQPVVMDCFAKAGKAVDARRRVLTTVASWEPSECGPVIGGTVYGGKSVEFLRFMNLPRSCALPIEVAMSGRPPVDKLRSNGWILANANEVSIDPWVYRSYLADSLAEWSVAKNAYVASRSGWFSCRSACYLALGVPAIVQDTGFGCSLPTSEGILAFGASEEAKDAIDRVLNNPQRHSEAAKSIAEEYFNSDRVLSLLIEKALTTDGSRSANMRVQQAGSLGLNH